MLAHMPNLMGSITRLTYFLISFLIVAVAQPDWSAVGCIIASCCGYALFWQSISSCTSRKSRFWSSVIWFGSISAIHLNWFFSDRYVGSFIYLFLGFLSLGLGIQFALFTLLIKNPKEMGWPSILGISGGWTLCEWSRLFIMTGYSLDPVGIALSGTVVSMQMASIVGIYGLSFWVFFTNLLVLRFFNLRSRRNGWIGLAIVLFPYVIGIAHLTYHSQKMERDALHTPPLETLLVQTALVPEDKFPINGSVPFSPLNQWRHILSLIEPHLDLPIDLIILPEGTVPYGTYQPIYTVEEIEFAFRDILHKSIKLPKGSQKVGNIAWAQALADLTGSDVILGLEDLDLKITANDSSAYNAAFFVQPFNTQSSRYEKRVLVPMGEYIPFQWCKRILSKYGIMDSFSPGKEAKVFSLSRNGLEIIAGISICYEETYGFLMRQSHQKGAQLLVNLTNDVWYPRSRLPAVHFFHGRLRGIELGVPVLRACNTGVTCGIDALGRTVKQLPAETVKQLASPAALSISLPLYHFPTVYALWGDSFPIGISAFLFISFFISKCFKRKQFKIKGFYVYPLRKN